MLPIPAHDAHPRPTKPGVDAGFSWLRAADDHDLRIVGLRKLKRRLNTAPTQIGITICTRQLLAQAVEMEAEAFLLAMKGLKLPDGRDRLVRHGHGPERTIQTGIGPVEVERVKIWDRAAAEDGERIRFTSAILPLWARRTKSLDTRFCRCSTCGAFRRVTSQSVSNALLGADNLLFSRHGILGGATLKSPLKLR